MKQAQVFDGAIALAWREADLLDRRAYEEWLDLWEPDGLYIVPIEKSMDDYADRLNYAYDDAEMRRMRVARLKSSHSMSALNAAATVRTVSRFVLVDGCEGELCLRAAQHLVEYRRDRAQMIAANVEITARETASGLKLVRKIVRLINSEDAVTGMGYLL